MRRQSIVTTFVLLAGCAIGLVGVSSQHQITGDVYLTNTEFQEPPPSLREMALEADAVVIGRILGGESKGVGFRRKLAPGITTFYRFAVDEVLQSFGERCVDPSELTIVKAGGTIERGNKLVTEEIDVFPQFDLGHRYVLFLRWHAEYEAWTPAWGPHGTFEVKAGKVHPVGFAEVSKAQDGLAVSEFLKRLRGLS